MKNKEDYGLLFSLIKKSLRTGLEKVNSLISAKIDSKPELNDLSKILFQRQLKINLLDIGSLGALGSNDPVYKNFNQTSPLLNLICFEPQTIKGKVDFPSYDLALYKTKGQINLNILKSRNVTCGSKSMARSHHLLPQLF